MATFQVRTCSKCGLEKDLESFYFIKSRQYRLAICKSCENARKQQWLKDNPEKIDAKRKQGRIYARKYRAENKDKVKNSIIDYRKDNPDKVKYWKKNDYVRNKIKYQERNRNYYLLNKKQASTRNNSWVENNKERIREIKRKYNNSDKGRVAKHNNRALRREMAAGYKITYKDILELKEQQKEMCFYCGKPLNNKWDLEHIIPISKGGEHKLYNIVLACKKCNNKKYIKDPEQFVDEILREVI